MAGTLEIHGDNILECERALQLVEAAFESNVETTQTSRGPVDSFASPAYLIPTDEGPITVRLFPGFGADRWDDDVMRLITENGGLLREAPDAIIGRNIGPQLQPLFAVEYCSALDAGNQAWQRHGRAYSSAQAGIPFLYVSEIGGAELDAERNQKSIRTPNPLAPYSFLIGGKRLNSPLLPTFTLNPEALLPDSPEFGNVHGGQPLLDYTYQLLKGEEPSGGVRDNLENKVLEFVEALVRLKSRNTSLNQEGWERLHEIVRRDLDGILPYLRDEVGMDWSKKIYMKAATDDIKWLLERSSEHGVALTGKDLPFGLIPGSVRSDFANAVESRYELSQSFREWLREPGDLVVCWVAGYKRSGRDARPDRGLLPMCRMLVGEEVDLISIVYGPTSSDTWETLATNPNGLIRTNGLWQAVLGLSDAVLVDSYWEKTDTRFRFDYTSDHWEDANKGNRGGTVNVSSTPKTVGEHDVDTVLHTLFSTLEEAGIYEGFCNPPGGDWSFIALRSADQREEHRWLSLRRVPDEGRKRPDHVAQLFPPDEEYPVDQPAELTLPDRPVCISTESKESRGRLKKDVGHFLKDFIRHLLEVPANVARRSSEADWYRPTRPLDLADFTEVSCVALLASSGEELSATGDKADADLVIGVEMTDSARSCTLHIYGRTASGRRTANLIFLHCKVGRISHPEGLEVILYSEDS